MNISIKVKNSIIAQLDKIKNDTFQEEDIKELLRDTRPMIREESLLRELADFFSHPEGTDRGIFNFPGYSGSASQKRPAGHFAIHRTNLGRFSAKEICQSAGEGH